MSKASIKTKVRKAQPGVGIIDVKGDISGFARQDFESAYMTASAGDTHTILLDLHRLRHINSSGIRLLIDLLARPRRQDLRVIAFGVKKHHRQILELTHLSDAVGPFDTEAAALAAAQLHSERCQVKWLSLPLPEHASRRSGAGGATAAVHRGVYQRPGVTSGGVSATIVHDQAERPAPPSGIAAEGWAGLWAR